jgi:hypothetical protein
MGCDFKERLREQVLARPGVYQVDQVKAQLMELALGMGKSTKELVGSIPRESGGYAMRGVSDVSKPRWQGERLQFAMTFKVQASFVFWIDVVEINIKGDFTLTRAADPSVIKALAVNMELRFDAHDRAVQGLKGRIPEVEGQPAPADTCKAIQGFMAHEFTNYLKGLSSTTRASLLSFKR